MSDWILVSERLPDPEIKVLGVHADVDDPIGLAYHDGKDWHDEEGWDAAITHWMPLPEPPK